jgi:hypothetical protein
MTGTCYHAIGWDGISWIFAQADIEPQSSWS